LGGVLRLVNRHLCVECLPEEIPSVFEVDIKSLAVGQYKKFSDLAIPENVRPKADLDEVVVVIAKK
jgi:large subunit ribosomal protein L25